MMAMGVNAGRNFIEGGVAKYAPGVSDFYQTLRYYFAVNNSYVGNKLKAILLPVVKKSWVRELAQDGTLSFQIFLL